MRRMKPTRCRSSRSAVIRQRLTVVSVVSEGGIESITSATSASASSTLSSFSSSFLAQRPTSAVASRPNVPSKCMPSISPLLCTSALSNCSSETNTSPRSRGHGRTLTESPRTLSSVSHTESRTETSRSVRSNGYDSRTCPTVISMPTRSDTCRSTTFSTAFCTGGT